MNIYWEIAIAGAILFCTFPILIGTGQLVRLAGIVYKQAFKDFWSFIWEGITFKVKLPEQGK